MRIDWLEIGATPCEEPCIQVGDNRWTTADQRAECAIYKRQLEREFPQGRFSVQGFDHDFGRYYEVVAKIEDAEDSPVTRAAFEAEGGAQPNWDAQALAELAEAFPGGYVRAL